MKNYSRIYASIDLNAITHNMENIKRNIHSDTKIMAVLKADAYGHGAVPIARHIKDLDYLWGFGVATADEAVKLRKNGIGNPILVLGYTFQENYETMVDYDIRPSVFQLEMAQQLSAAAQKLGKTVKVHLIVDTGMNTIGFPDTQESIKLIQNIQLLPNLEVEGLYTQFARADETSKRPAYVQLDRYLIFLEQAEKAGIHIPLKHCSNSASLIRVPEADLDMVRAGIALYGLYPSNKIEKDIVTLQPVMSLKSHIAYIKTVPAEVAISFGGTFKTDWETKIAAIPVGYADGYARFLSNKGHVLIRGQKAPILGRICMDQFVVDVTRIPNVQEQDPVTLLGTDEEMTITADELGDLCGRFNYEFLTEINKRVPRVYIKDGEIVEQIDYFEED